MHHELIHGFASPTLPHPGAFDFLFVQIPYNPLPAPYWGVGRDIDRRIMTPPFSRTLLMSFHQNLKIWL